MHGLRFVCYGKRVRGFDRMKIPCLIKLTLGPTWERGLEK